MREAQAGIWRQEWKGDNEGDLCIGLMPQTCLSYTTQIHLAKDGTTHSLPTSASNLKRRRKISSTDFSCRPSWWRQCLTWGSFILGTLRFMSSWQKVTVTIPFLHTHPIFKLNWDQTRSYWLNLKIKERRSKGAFYQPNRHGKGITMGLSHYYRSAKLVLSDRPYDRWHDGRLP